MRSSPIVAIVGGLAAICLASRSIAAEGNAVNHSPAGCQQRLRSLLHRLVEDGKHYGPGVLWVEDHKKIMWFEGQAVAMIAAAYAHAADADKPALSRYLKSEVTGTLLDAKYTLWENTGTLTRPGNEVLRWSKNNATGWMALYGVYAYARATGDWELVKQNAAAIKALWTALATPPSQIVSSRNTFVLHNAQYNGAWAAAQIARDLNDDAWEKQASAAREQARTQMLANIDDQVNKPAHDGRLRFIACLDCLTSESAAVYATDATAREQIAALIESVPRWWMNGMNLGGAGGEGSFQPPSFASQVFLAKAWILKAPYEPLARQLPWPNVYATMPSYRDLQYLQNLAAILDVARAQKVSWEPPQSRSVRNEPSPAAAKIDTGADWSQFLGNPQHTGAGDAQFPDISNPKLLWKHAMGERPMLMAHPLIVRDTVYIANMDGKLTALDAGTGAGRWEFAAGGPIGVCPAVVDGGVHFGSFDGFQYCLDLEGKLLWKVPTGAPILSAPCVVEGKVFIGNNDGLFLALDAASGKELWRFAAAERIISNPAYFNGLVYFASDDMHAYACRMADGTLAWKKLLTGESNRWNSPTIVPKTGYVVFTTVPHEPINGMGFKDLYARYYLGHVAFRDGKWSKHPFTLIEALQTYSKGLEAASDQRSIHVLDGTTGEPINRFWARDDRTGQELKVTGLPMNIWYQNGNNRPIVWKDQYLLIQCFGNMLKIDTVSGRIEETHPDGIARGDEYTPITVWGDKVYAGIAGNLASLDLLTNKRRQIRGVFGVEKADATPMDQRIGTWGGGTGDGYSQGSGFITIHDGRLYYCAYGWIYCFGGIGNRSSE